MSRETNSTSTATRLKEIIKRIAYYPLFPENDERIRKKALRTFIDRKSTQVLPDRTGARTLSIVVPCYRHAGFIKETIGSVLGQTRLPDEIIFVNDASPDATGSILREVADSTAAATGTRQPEITVIENPVNKGQAYSLNAGIAAAGSDLVMVLNDDDILFLDAVEAVIRLFESHQDIFLLGCTCIPFTGSGTPEKCGSKISDLVRYEEIPVTIHRSQDVTSYSGPNEINMTHSGCTFLKAAWESVGGYYENKRSRVIPYSDRDFQLRVNCLFPIGVSYDVPFVFWRSDSSVDSGLNS